MTNTFTLKGTLVSEMGGGRKCSFNTEDLSSVAPEPPRQLLTWKVGSLIATRPVGPGGGGGPAGKGLILLLSQLSGENS